MGKHVANHIIKTLIRAKQDVHEAKIAILGLAFKENVGDVRNTKVIDIMDELHDYGIDVLVHDPLAEKEEVREEFNIELIDEDELTDLDCIVLAVPHNKFKVIYTLVILTSIYRIK